MCVEERLTYEYCRHWNERPPVSYDDYDEYCMMSMMIMLLLSFVQLTYRVWLCKFSLAEAY